MTEEMLVKQIFTIVGIVCGSILMMAIITDIIDSRRRRK